MKIFILTILSALSFSQSGLAATTPCFTAIAAHEKWGTLSDKQIYCIQNDTAYKPATAVLCVSDESDISPVYSGFISYDADLAAARAKIDAAKTPIDTLLAMRDYDNANRARTNYGYTHKIWDVLNPLDWSQHECVRNIP